MQRDWEVVRQVLLGLEQLGTGASVVPDSDVPPYDRENVAYHMKLLAEAGIVDAHCTETTGGTHCLASRLTWAGHEFLDHVRDHTVWNRIEATAREKGLALSFDVITAAAGTIVANVLK